MPPHTAPEPGSAESWEEILHTMRALRIQIERDLQDNACKTSSRSGYRDCMARSTTPARRSIGSWRTHCRG